MSPESFDFEPSGHRIPLDLMTLRSVLIFEWEKKNAKNPKASIPFLDHLLTHLADHRRVFVTIFRTAANVFHVEKTSEKITHCQLRPTREGKNKIRMKNANSNSLSDAAALVCLLAMYNVFLSFFSFSAFRFSIDFRSINRSPRIRFEKMLTHAAFKVFSSYSFAWGNSKHSIHVDQLQHCSGQVFSSFALSRTHTPTPLYKTR